jgi:hypothetical protein
MCVFVYMYIYIYIYIYVYIYIHTHLILKVKPDHNKVADDGYATYKCALKAAYEPKDPGMRHHIHTYINTCIHTYIHASLSKHALRAKGTRHDANIYIYI